MGPVRDTVDPYEGLRTLPKTTSVYFLLSSCGTRLKIGKAHNPRTRIRDIRAMNPHRLTVLLVVFGYTHVEGALHSMFSRYREHGEWFRFEGQVVDVAERLRSGAVAIEHILPGPVNVDRNELANGTEQHHIER